MSRRTRSGSPATCAAISGEVERRRGSRPSRCNAGLLAASSAFATPGGLGAQYELTSQQSEGVCTRPVLQVLGTHPPTCGVPSTVRSVLVSGRPLKLNGLIPECIETVLSARTAPAASMPRHGVRPHECSAHCAEPFAARAEFQWWRKCVSRHQQPWPRACQICLSAGEPRVLLSSGTDVAAADHALLHCCMHLARTVECKRRNVLQAGRPGRTFDKAGAARLHQEHTCVLSAECRNTPVC